jgi:hypothetical protein
MAGPGLPHREGRRHHSAMDQHLLELAVRACGGEIALASALQTDVPAIDWWRRTGVPDEMYHEIRAVTIDAPPGPPIPPI